MDEDAKKQLTHIEETVDALARAVAQGFDSIREEFEKTNSKIEGLGRRMDVEAGERMQLDARVQKLEQPIKLEFLK